MRSKWRRNGRMGEWRKEKREYEGMWKKREKGSEKKWEM